MIIIAQLFAIGSVLYMIKVLLYPFYKPTSGGQKKRTRQYINARKKEQLKRKTNEAQKTIISRYGVFLMSDSARKKVRELLKHLDMDMMPEEVRLKQITFALCAVVLTVFVFAVSNIFGFASILLVVLMYLYPMDELVKKADKRQKKIAQEFPAFYSMVYYQYSKTVHIYLADIVKDYLPNAREDLARELSIMLDNMEYGEEFALRQLKKRVPIHYVVKFCDIMEIRLRGYDNIAQMLYLKNEIDQFRVDALEKEMDKRQAANDKLQLVLVVVLGIYIITYFVFNVLSALKMFQ